MKIIIIAVKFLLLFLIGVLIIIILAIILVNLFTSPSNDRDWNDDQKMMPYSEITGDLVTIHNIRNFKYASTTSFTENYYDKTFNLNEIKGVSYVVEPFSGIPGSAHTFLTFEFEKNQFVSISIEIRKQKGESFHPVKGLFNQYELMYVIADEKDVIKLRSNYRKDPVFLYPAKTTKQKAKELFMDMILRANHLKDHPEFYNSVANTCTTNIVHHINAVSPKRVPLLNLQVFLPENSDRLAYNLGLIDTDLPFEEARKRFKINERAEKYADSPDFSVKIRQEN